MEQLEQGMMTGGPEVPTIFAPGYTYQKNLSQKAKCVSLKRYEVSSWEGYDTRVTEARSYRTL
jgi:hypothetical protein